MGLQECKEISPRDFISGILDGKRAFLGIRLTNSDLTANREMYRRFNSFLKEKSSTLERDPVDVSRSRLNRLKAPEVCLPFLRAIDSILDNADLRRANLGHANLANASLKNADLRYANLECANLGNASLKNANLRNADLGYANLWYADMEYAVLDNADLKNANLGYADLGNANLWYSDLRYATLGYAGLRNANLAHADLRGVRKLEDARFLERAKFARTKVSEIERKIVEASLGKNVLLDVT